MHFKVFKYFCQCWSWRQKLQPAVARAAPKSIVFANNCSTSIATNAAAQIPVHVPAPRLQYPRYRYWSGTGTGTSKGKAKAHKIKAVEKIFHWFRAGYAHNEFDL
jgi:hypothetical protein